MIGIAAVFGGASIFLANGWLQSAASTRAPAEKVIVAQAPAHPEVELASIVVAKGPLAFGTRLDGSLLKEIPWPRKELPEGSFSTVSSVMEEGPRVVLSPIATNEPVLLPKLSGPGGRGTLSNLLSPGMRAVTIRTDEIAGVGGFITPGDRVDVVLTRNAGAIQEVAGNAKGAAGSTVATEVVVEDVKVLSVGQGADESQTSPKIVNSVTVEVTPDAASKVALARNVGTLSLTLRPASDGGASERGVTTISAFSGSNMSAITKKASALFGDDQPEQKQFQTVIVTRGMDEKSYEVVVSGQSDLPGHDGEN